MGSDMVTNYKFLNFITSIFVAVLLISNIASTKVVEFGFFTFDGGTLLFPVSYVLGDILTEVYGFKEARKIIWMGFLSAALMSFVIWLVGILPAAPEWTNQESYNIILGTNHRIVFGSLSAYFLGSLSNSIILSKMKIFTNGKYLWTRTIGSTIIGEAIDTSIFIFIAFFGIFSNSLLFSIFISNYIFKVGFEVMLTPVTYKAVSILKNIEKIDVYDTNISYNPFLFLSR